MHTKKFSTSKVYLHWIQVIIVRIEKFRKIEGKHHPITEYCVCANSYVSNQSLREYQNDTIYT